MEIEYNSHQPEDDTSHIISMLLMTRPQYQAEIEQAVNSQEGCEVHGNDEKGKTIVVIEATSNRELVERMESVQNLKHLVSSSLVFHQIA